MMRSPWVAIIGVGLGIIGVPACNPLLRPPPGDPPPQPSPKRAEAGDPALPRAPSPDGPAHAAITPIVDREMLAEPVHDPAGGSSTELIPEPRNPAEIPSAAAGAAPLVRDTPGESHSDVQTKPAEEPPLLEAVRCILDNRPADAVACLGRYERPTQELLLCLLPLAVRLAEQDGRHQDPREAGALLDQLDRLAYALRRRAPLRITKMYLCADIQGYGKYRPLPEGYGFRPGELARLYVELQNLSDAWQGTAYSFHLLTTVEIRDFNRKLAWRYTFHDPGPDFSHSERHDFYHLCTFPVPKRNPGLYTLYVKITDVATGREVQHTLDFRIGSGRNGG